MKKLRDIYERGVNAILADVNNKDVTRGEKAWLEICELLISAAPIFYGMRRIITINHKHRLAQERKKICLIKQQLNHYE